MTYRDQAVARLKKECEGSGFDRYGNAMKDAVLKKLCFFCRQDEEFAQAVVQGGAFADCMKAVSKKVKNSCIEDFAAYEEAVRFYFPGAGIRCTMTIDLCASVENEAEAEESKEEKPVPPHPEREGKKAILLDLSDYL